MNVFLLEIKKSWLRLPVLIALLLFSALNFYKISEEYKLSGRANDEKMDSYRTAYFDIYNNILSGEVTDEKISYIKKNLFSLRKQVESGNYSTTYDDKTLTGYVYSDWCLFEFDFYPAYEYIITYPNISNGIASRAYENAAFFSDIKNDRQAKINYYICTLYQNRKIRSLHLTEWVELYFKYDFSSLLIIIMIIIGLSSSFSYEKESGMDIIIRCHKGAGKVIRAKIVSASLYIILLTCYWSVFDFLTLKMLCGVDGLNVPIYSAEFFKFSPFSFSLLSAMLVCMAAKMCGFLVIGYLILLISAYSPNTIISLCTAFLTMIGLIAVTEINSSVINPVNMLTAYKRLREFDCVFLFGKPVLSLYFEFALYSAIIILLIVVIKFKALKNKRRCL